MQVARAAVASGADRLAGGLGSGAALAHGLIECNVSASRFTRWARQAAFVEKFRSLALIARSMNLSCGASRFDDGSAEAGRYFDGIEQSDPHESARQERIQEQLREIASTQPRDERGRFASRSAEQATHQPG